MLTVTHYVLQLAETLQVCQVRSAARARSLHSAWIEPRGKDR